jgi:hypothetical protein
MRLETAIDPKAAQKKAREDAIKSREAQKEAQKQARDDRNLIPGIMRHLYVAGQTLVHGRIGTAEKITHGISQIMHTIETTNQKEAAFSHKGVPEGAYSYSPGPGELNLPDATSVQRWTQSVEKMMLVANQLPNGPGCLPTDFKRHLADLLKQGRMLCGGGSSMASEARGEMAQAAQLYSKLSGTSFL